MYLSCLLEWPDPTDPCFGELAAGLTQGPQKLLAPCPSLLPCFPGPQITKIKLAVHDCRSSLTEWKLGVAHMPRWPTFAEEPPENACPKVISPQADVGFAPQAVTPGGLAAGLTCQNAHADVSTTQLSRL